MLFVLRPMVTSYGRLKCCFCFAPIPISIGFPFETLHIINVSSTYIYMYIYIYLCIYIYIYTPHSPPHPPCVMCRFQNVVCELQSKQARRLARCIFAASVHIYIYITVYSCAMDLAFGPTVRVHLPGTGSFFY